MTFVLGEGLTQADLQRKAEHDTIKKLAVATRKMEMWSEVSSKATVDGAEETAKLARAMSNIALLGSAWMEATHPEVWAGIKDQWQSEPVRKE